MTATIYPQPAEIEDILVGPDSITWQRASDARLYVAMVYGGDQAVAAGRRVRELHGRFQGVREDGRRYHALAPDAYAWLHATLIQMPGDTC